MNLFANHTGWLWLLTAILLEISGTTCMKISDGFTRPLPSLLLCVFYVLSFAALTMAIKRLEVSAAYAVWSGLGTALIAVIGILWFRETATTLKILSLALIILGVVGLNASSVIPARNGRAASTSQLPANPLLTRLPAAGSHRVATTSAPTLDPSAPPCEYCETR